MSGPANAPASRPGSGPANAPASGSASGPANGPASGPATGQRHTPWRAAFFALAILGIVAGVGWALVGSRFLVVRSIQVTGTHLVPRADVLAAAAVPQGLPLIRVNTAAVAHRIERIRQIESARVSRAWPDALTISVRERTPVLAVPSGRGYQLIDRFGVPVLQAATRPKRMPRLTLQPGPAGSAGAVVAIASLRDSPAVYAAAAVLRELPARLAARVTTVAAPSASDVTLTLADGVTIVWGGPDRPVAKAKELTVLMHTHARSYDVSAPETAMTGG